MIWQTLAPDSPGWAHFNYRVNISLAEHWVYVEIPKCACSSIKATLREALTGRLGPQLRAEEAFPEIHAPWFASPHVKPYQLSASQLNEVLSGHDFVRFVALRDPFRRLVSAFFDKVRIPGPHSQAFWTTQGARQDATSDIEIFGAFLEHVAATPDTERDPHWQTQTRVGMLLDIHYSVTLDADRLDRDWERLRRMVPGLPPLGQKKLNTSRRPDDLEKYRQFFSTTVSELYAIDYESISRIAPAFRLG